MEKVTKAELRTYRSARKMTDSEARFAARTDGRIQGDFSFLNRQGERCEFCLANATIKRIADKAVTCG